MFKFINNSKFGHTSGVVGEYGTEGYILEG